MPAPEKRLPREVFTKKLRRICERLDEASTRAISYKHFFFPRTIAEEVTVSEVWVVGSYARGAPLCGDLDVVLKVAGQKGEPPVPAVTRVFFGTLPYVRYYLGDPSKNQSGVEFPDAVRIWSGQGCPWRASINSIVINPLAGRAPRAVDAIPLRLEQLRADIDQLEALVGLREAQQIEWEFIELPQAAPTPANEAPSWKSEDALDRYTDGWGRKSKALLPKLILLMRELEPHGEWVYSSYDGNGSHLRCGGTRLFVGLPAIHAHLLDENPSVRQLAIVPHESARGPNGAWLIRRGRLHADVQALSGVHLYYHLDNGRPLVMSSGMSTGVAALELFESAEEAEEYSIWESDMDTVKMEVACATGTSLLEVLGLCDIVVVDGVDIAINHRGMRHAEQQISSTAELVSLIRRPAVRDT